MPSSSRMSVAVTAHNSMRRCQSAELRARRDTSKPHDNAGLAERDLADELLEAVTCRRIGSGLSEIAIDDMDVFDQPAGSNSAIT